MAAHEGLHEPAQALSPQTLDMHRAIVSLSVSGVERFEHKQAGGCERA